MTFVGIAGDWHGNIDWTAHVLGAFRRAQVHTIFQVGDFGVGWPGAGEQYTAAVDMCCQLWDQTLYITPGNHENWDYLNALPYQNGQAWIGERVCVLERNTRFEMDGRQFLSLGGAPSIDFPHRIEGHSWWHGEMLTEGEVRRAAEGGHADIMLAHDAPTPGTAAVQRIVADPRGWTTAGVNYAAEGRRLMDIAFEGVRPKVFAHGHYHVADEAMVDGTHFLSLGQDGRVGQKKGNAVILDLSDLSVEWVAGT